MWRVGQHALLRHQQVPLESGVQKPLLWLSHVSGLGRSHCVAQVRGLQNGAGDVIADIITFQGRDAPAVGDLRDWRGAVREHWSWQAITGF